MCIVVDFSMFERNGVVLGAHDATVSPIGPTVDTKLRGNGIVSTVEFSEPGVCDLADQVHNLIEGGFIKAASIGFRPIESGRNDEGGIDFKRVELLE